MATRIQLDKGIYSVDGRSQIMVSADYPYYRDTLDNWRHRLIRLRDDCRVNIITFYIPWRHHQPRPDSPPDFNGHSQANRNVIHFIQLCAELNLYCIAKPGPFIHAETNFGGLPDWTSPSNTPTIQAWQSAEGQPNTWSSAIIDNDGFISGVEWSLPAPFDPIFLMAACKWLTIVGQEVITPYAHPNGPIIFAQIANEGIYSDGHLLWDYDYSPSSLARYRAWLAKQYGDIAVYNRRNATTYTTWEDIEPPRHPPVSNDLQSLQQYIDWGDWCGRFYEVIYREWGNALNVSIPLLVNPNPPQADEGGVDAWLTRVVPEVWPSVNYGFTNWIGDVSADISAYDRYLLAAKRMRGINLEENWGFSKLYDPSYVDAATSFYQTLLAIAGGASGYNIYTGVSTAAWDNGLDALHERPYPATAPITKDGELLPKATTLRWLNHFLDEHGTEFLDCRAEAQIAYGVYLPYAACAAWSKTMVDMPICGMALNTFQREMDIRSVDYGLINLAANDWGDYTYIALHGWRWMDALIAERLRAHAEKGGIVYFTGQIPDLDEHSQPTRTLQHPHIQLINTWQALPISTSRAERISENGRIWIRAHPKTDVLYVIVLIPANGPTRAEFNIELNGRMSHLAVQAALGGGAFIRIADRHITSALVKGHNGWRGSAVKPLCTLDGNGPALNTTGDFLWLNGQFIF